MTSHVIWWWPGPGQDRTGQYQDQDSTSYLHYERDRARALTEHKSPGWLHPSCCRHSLWSRGGAPGCGSSYLVPAEHWPDWTCRHQQGQGSQSEDRDTWGGRWGSINNSPQWSVEITYFFQLVTEGSQLLLLLVSPRSRPQKDNKRHRRCVNMTGVCWDLYTFTFTCPCSLI